MASFSAAGRRACPAMISSSPTKIGFVQPHSRIDAAMWATCSRLCVRGLLARGIRRSIGQRSIWMSISTGGLACAFFAIHPSIAIAGFSRQQSIPSRIMKWLMCLFALMAMAILSLAIVRVLVQRRRRREDLQMRDHLNRVSRTRE
jgi:hypothetical protein